MLLTAILFLPLILGAITFFFVPVQLTKYATLLNAVLTFALSVFAAVTFEWSGTFTQEVFIFGKAVETTFQHHIHIPWPLFEQYQISYTLGVDNLSMLMVLLTTSLGIIGVLCSFTAIEKRVQEYYFYLMILQTGVLGVFLALDLLLFFMAFEVMVLPMAFLIGIYGSKNRMYASMKFVIYSLVGSLAMFLSFLWIYYNGIQSFSLEAILAADLGVGFQRDIPYLAMMLAFLIKAPLWPFHTWLPDAHTEAPTAGSVILAGVLLKTGVYGMLRFAIPLFPIPAVSFAPIITWLSVIAIIYGAMCAMVQTDVKKLVAYSSVSHMGFIILGIFCFNGPGMSGAIIQMINHGISTGGLFLAVGMIYERRHTREMAEFGGLAKNLPIFAALTMVMMLSSVGLPGLNGFVGEFPILIGSMKNLPMIQQAQDSSSIYATLGMVNYTWVVAALAASGVILGAVYLLIMYQKVFFGKLDKPENIELKDLNFREIFQLSVLGIAALVIGLFPNLLLKPIQSTTDVTLQYVAGPLSAQDNTTALAAYVEQREAAAAEALNHDSTNHTSESGLNPSSDSNASTDQ
ncbi:MAG: NuoM family protein [Sumerlaeia bacterium]